MNSYEEARFLGIKGQRQREQADFDALFAPTYPSPPDNGTSTSREAAVKIMPHADTQRAEILAVIAASDAGLTREQVGEITGLAGDSVRPRVYELIAARVVRQTEDTRLTHSGRRAYILKAV